ncbi:MAG: sensor histidine kinase [Calditrichaceae bacterium]|nr:ATP-binding protein [Calditrichia bacterium]NUQ42763.1 sensor histidine kinase [Calditrichaceae bacterium]
MAKNVYRVKGNFKSFLFILAVVITGGFLVYTQQLVAHLQDQSRDFLRFKVKVFEENISNEEITDLNFFFNNVIQTADYPSIYADAQMVPQFWRNIGIPQSNGQQIDPDTLAMVARLMEEFEKVNPPIPITYQGMILGYYIYGESAIIKKLRWLPVIEIIVVGMFILIGYAGFHSIKKSEERLIWVGMAKETAHQLGTPLSSLMGWVEYLKLSPSQLEKVLPEVRKDLQRLEVITNRFSQIGSLPDLKPENLGEIILETAQYFQSRIPQKNGKVQLFTELDPGISKVNLNRDLFSWVLENLVKNGLDALENEGGTITISSGMLGDAQVFIDVKDTGKGIAGSAKKDLFKPGFSTKKRGWGLGLSLAKRIVEDYHGGKLTLKETQVGTGSTFRIALKIS